jgi:succinate dehydrogenase (ubiquinone) cytochrome b560 subunit
VSNVAAASEKEDYDAKNARLGRPQSPHLTIYKPQLTSLLSFTHRTTGIVLGGIATVWGIGKIIALQTHFLVLEYYEYYKYRNILNILFLYIQTIIN